ncbi:elongation factor P [candidate division KSB1 bacterium]|nr:elongation factor P [candidate division KSB1 bacterium]
MVSISNFRTGMAIRHNHEIWIVTEFTHVTPGNWRAMVRTKLKNVKTGRVIDITYRMTDDVEVVRLDEKSMQFLYESDDNLYFMDTETYDQVVIPEEFFGDKKRFLREGDMCVVQILEGQPITAELPNSIVFKVIEAEPGIKGDSATNIMKYAIIETGAKVLVPLFIKEGDKIKIDTNTGKYLERVAVK